eukprot:scaffold87325_cov48-Phaeocystis_antarctica.AAC.8
MHAIGVSLDPVPFSDRACLPVPGSTAVRLRGARFNDDASCEERPDSSGMPGFTEAVLCWLPAKTAIEAAGKVEDGYCLFESELALLRERVSRREQTPSHLAAVAASASGLAMIEERLAGGVLLSGDELTELRVAAEAATAPATASAARVPPASAKALFRAATAATVLRIHTHRR